MRIYTLTIYAALVWGGAHAPTDESGRRQFQARCASCHGEDGTGGARGFNIVNLPQPRAASREAIRDLILKGIPDRGMPPFPISDPELESIVTYVMSLKPAAADAAATSGGTARGGRAGGRCLKREGERETCH